MTRRICATVDTRCTAHGAFSGTNRVSSITTGHALGNHYTRSDSARAKPAAMLASPERIWTPCQAHLSTKDHLTPQKAAPGPQLGLTAATETAFAYQFDDG